MKSKILVLARFAAAAVLSAAAMSSSYAATVEGTDANAILSAPGIGTVLNANATVGSGVEFTFNANSSLELPRFCGQVSVLVL